MGEPWVEEMSQDGCSGWQAMKPGYVSASSGRCVHPPPLHPSSGAWAPVQQWEGSRTSTVHILFPRSHAWQFLMGSRMVSEAPGIPLAALASA